MFIEGSLQTRKWQDQQGYDRNTTEIKATRVVFLDRRNEVENGPMEEETPPSFGRKQENAEIAIQKADKIEEPWDLDIPSDDVPDLPF